MQHLAAASSGQQSTLSPLFYLLPLVLLAVMFWFSRRRQKQFAAAQREIAVGDQVSTTSGLLGTLVALDESEGVIEAAPGVQLRFDRRAIVPRRLTENTADGTSTPTEPTDRPSDDQKA
ncbi:preprotein translocase subunit YajC [Calidifontibacter sp. DB0510]|uniref:Preprotein translocase subunit YajC n=1 Tax=Metallococcus carri TaxID=1656884 RepID=A0A967EBI5_9MICO|nr:preprotein translocase subunit YajC [Metallococcus carri]NHN56989.1 preprotein translocase subunit YajC [Metallococcus carri]NOP37734.1 preprotein translocase subunit YajC [Calidifontibacter sp. DB2511S]